MGFFKRQLLKVIDWTDDSRDTIVYRFPMEEDAEIMMGSKLTVRESQVAVFVNKGQLADVFTPGMYKLEARNIPVLTALNSWKYGFDSPFKAEVYFVNTRQFINQKWGTVNPIMMRDPDFGMVRLRGYGSFAYRVKDAPVFLKEIIGTSGRYSAHGLTDYLKSLLVTGISDCIGEAKIAAIDLAGNLLEFSEGVKSVMRQRFTDLGLELSEFVIENVSLPEEVEKAMDTRTSLGVLGDKMGTYTQYQAANAMRDAAKNPGNAFAGMGVGFGAGGAMGNMMASSLTNAKDEPNPPREAAATAAPKKVCPKCGAEMRAAAKFCPECGENVAQKVCRNCGASMKASAKFCPECGTAAHEKCVCPKCGHEILKASAKFCPECGEAL